MEILRTTKNPEAHFSKAFELYSDAIYRHCYFRTSDNELAKEITQDTFMRTWKYISGGNEIKDIKPFLYRTATNLIINEYKKQKRRPTVSLDALQEKTGFDVEDLQKMESNAPLDEHALNRLLSSVKEPERSLLVMRYIDELKPAEISALVGMSTNVVSVRLSRALRQLRSRFNHE